MNEKWNVIQESLYNIDWKMKVSEFYLLFTNNLSRYIFQFKIRETHIWQGRSLLEQVFFQ